MEKGKVLSLFLAGSISFVGNANAVQGDLTHDGFFIGMGADFNSVNFTQNSWGKGVSNILTSTGANSNGVGQGNGVPFHHITNTLSPSVQAGYFKHIGDTRNLLGVKFFYQYLGVTATNSNLFIPQLGQSTSAITGVTSALYGYVDGTSIQSKTNHNMALLLFAGHSFGNTTLYIGAGPSLVNIKSQNYDSIGYAEFNGATINVTGLVNYHSPSIWTWGGTAQLGATYFFMPSVFLDLSYTYTATGDYTVNHQQNFTNSSNIGGITYATAGTLYTRNTMSVQNQSVMLSINKVF